jgi:hypothetical protein
MSCIIELKYSASTLTIYTVFWLFRSLKPLSAIVAQANTVEESLNHQLLRRTVEVSKDADKIKKAFKNMSILCDVFQVSLSSLWYDDSYVLILQYNR